jgi:hypothetical protein
LAQIEGGSLDCDHGLVLARDQASQGSLQAALSDRYLEGSAQVLDVNGDFDEDSY